MYKRRAFININEKVNCFSNVEVNKLMLKSLLSSVNFPFFPRVYFFYVMQKFNYFVSTSSFRRLCSVNGYSKSIFRLFKMSRHNCKKYSSLGIIVGMRKSSF